MKEKKLYLLLVAVFIFFSYTLDGFLGASNIINIIRQFSILGIMVVGLGIVMISGGVDFSVGEQISVDGMMLAVLIVEKEMPIVPAIMITMIFGMGLGLANSVICVRLKIDAPLATFGSMIILNGTVYMISKGHSIFDLPEAFHYLGTGYWQGIPISLLVLMVVAGLGFFVMEKTYYGRFLYALGDNPKAAELIGIDCKGMRTMAFVICSCFISIAAMITLSYHNTAFPYAGGEYLNDCFIACLLGGISLRGGEGKILKALGAALIISIVNSGLRIAGVSSTLSGCVKGLLLLVILSRNVIQGKKQKLLSDY